MIDRRRRFWQKARSVRIRLLSIALLPTLAIMPLFFLSTAYNWSSRFDNLLIAKVSDELTIAHQYLSRLMESSDLQMRAVADSAEFAAHIKTGDAALMRKFLQAQREQLGLDFLYYMSPDGEVLSSPEFAQTNNLVKWPVVSQALAGAASSNIDIFDVEDLQGVSLELSERARFSLVETQAAVPTDRIAETRGMMVHAATPVPSETRGGALVGGLLLNRNLEFIDTINDLVFPVGSLTEGSQGTATLFLEDVRVSTNVRLFENERALGTRVSSAVRTAVLERGEVWLDRAFVVNDWYISAYEPILDSFGNRVGMLYVGFLEAPFREAKVSTIMRFAIAFAVIVLISVPVFLRWARQIFDPLERMTGTIAKVEQGNLAARTGVENSGDEIGRVAAQMDDLLGQIEERDQELTRRVLERTRDLEEANRRLEATTKQLVLSEKLAAIGEIAAGVAHEVNNPVQVIQGNLDVLQIELGDDAERVKTELRLIDEQLHSIFLIVSKLSQFTRPDEFADGMEVHRPVDVVRDTIPLVQHLLNSSDISLHLSLETDCAIAVNRSELQQVLVNLIVNAIHAMPHGGQLWVSVSEALKEAGPCVQIMVRDNGSGMSEDVVARAFDPFFTTKQGEGTGLGLSISRRLVERFDGEIFVESTLGIGTTFQMTFPQARQSCSS